MNFTAYLCIGALTIFLLGLVFGDGPMAGLGFGLLLLGMTIVILDDD